MELPAKGSSYRKRVRFGRYVARKLKRNKHADLLALVLAITDRVRAAGRAWEDADDEAYGANAELEEADDDLDVIGQTARNALGGRGVDAINEAPYTLIFDRGITWYTAAPQDEEVSRYRMLAARLRQHLPEGDPVRAEADRIDAGIVGYEAATGSVDTARRGLVEAALTLATTEADFDRVINKVYSDLRGTLGAKKAERHFPKRRK